MTPKPPIPPQSAGIPLAAEKKEEGGRFLFRHHLLPLGRRIRKAHPTGGLKNANPPQPASFTVRNWRNGKVVVHGCSKIEREVGRSESANRPLRKPKSFGNARNAGADCPKLTPGRGPRSRVLVRVTMHGFGSSNRLSGRTAWFPSLSVTTLCLHHHSADRMRWVTLGRDRCGFSSIRSTTT